MVLGNVIVNFREIVMFWFNLFLKKICIVSLGHQWQGKTP
uniref:Uncharacterized protein n=1 Tax=Anguilla anguilla TaxID=7936 RepID=A0A0E9TWQ1_ANGAN